MVVDLYSSKVYVYPMRLRKEILQKMKLLYNEIKNKRKNKTMRFQVDNELKLVKIKDLNDENNVKMFILLLVVEKLLLLNKKLENLKQEYQNKMHRN